MKTFLTFLLLSTSIIDGVEAFVEPGDDAHDDPADIDPRFISAIM